MSGRLTGRDLMLAYRDWWWEVGIWEVIAIARLSYLTIALWPLTGHSPGLVEAS